MFSFFAFIENILPISFLLSIVGVLLSRLKIWVLHASAAMMLSGTLALLYAQLYVRLLQSWMHIEQYLYLFPSVLSALSWLSGNTGSSSMLVWQKLPPVHTSKSHLDLCIAGCQTSALSRFYFPFLHAECTWPPACICSAWTPLCHHHNLAGFMHASCCLY